MKIFLSAINNAAHSYLQEHGVRDYKWNLLSYYQIRKSEAFADEIKACSEEIMIDSGAHSFQFGTAFDPASYTKEYADFIRRYDSPKVVGFFEMDVDNIVGYDKVVQMRKELERVSDKIIPVWHLNRGIADFKRMCQEYSGRVVSITGFRNKDIRDDQYIMFLKYAWKYRCRVHCLGMTRKDVLNKVPFDYVDSSSWLRQMVYGRVWNPSKGKYMRVSTPEESRLKRKECYYLNYVQGMKEQEQYYQRWRKYNDNYLWK